MSNAATEVASFLEKWCTEARNQRPGAPSLTILTLVALHLAHQYLKLKEDHEALLGQIGYACQDTGRAMAHSNLITGALWCA